MHYLIAKLRTGVKEDFFYSDNTKRQNIPYFCKGANGEMQSKIYFFSDDTDVIYFKMLYAYNQIFVFADPTEPTHQFNCMDWDFITQQIDYEFNQPNNITP
jgi:hypothetical protein